MSDKPVWIESEKVILDYGFDPFVHIDPKNDNHIRNKLIVVKQPCGSCEVRVWLLEDILPVAKKAAELREKEIIRSLERRIVSQYRKGLRKDCFGVPFSG